MEPDSEFHFIYKTTCLLTGQFYIGLHSTFKLNDGYMGSGSRIKASLKQNGKANHKFEILEFLPTRNCLIARERELLTDSLLSNPLCLNVARGGAYVSKNRISGLKQTLSLTLPLDSIAIIRAMGESLGISISDSALSFIGLANNWPIAPEAEKYISELARAKNSPLGRKLALERELELLSIRKSKVEPEVAKELIAQARIEDIRIEKAIAEKATNLREFGSKLTHSLLSQIDREEERLLEQLAQTDKSFEGSFDALLLDYVKIWSGEKPYSSSHGPTTTAINLARDLVEKHGILAIKTFSGAWLYGLNMADWIRSICVSKKFPSREKCISAITGLQTFSLDQGREEFWQCLNSKGYFKLDGLAHLSDLKGDYGPLVLGSPLGPDNLPQFRADLLEALDFVDHLYKSNTKEELLSLSVLD